MKVYRHTCIYGEVSIMLSVHNHSIYVSTVRQAEPTFHLLSCQANFDHRVAQLGATLTESGALVAWSTCFLLHFPVVL